jgi:hypothetical protein
MSAMEEEKIAGLLALAFGAFLLLIAVPFAKAEKSHVQSAEYKNVSLALIGYNYTNKGIESYSLNGVDGGDIRLSSETSGGGGVTCCIDSFTVKPPAATVKVRWQVDGCMYQLKNEITGASQRIRHLYYKEKLVNVEDLSNGRPKYVETHLYQNGEIKVRLTKEISLPLMQANANRPDQSSFPRCKDDKRPR